MDASSGARRWGVPRPRLITRRQRALRGLSTRVRSHLDQSFGELGEHAAIEGFAAQHVVLPTRLAAKLPAPGASGPRGDAKRRACSTRVQTIVGTIQLEFDDGGLVVVDCA